MNVPINVVITARNYGRYLGEALDSVQAQTFDQFECLIVDDGSTDDTPAVLRRYQGDGRIRSVRTEGLGQSRAKNLGVCLTRAPFVAFLDADDVWLPTKLERQYALFEASPMLGMVHTARTLIGPRGEPLPAEPREPSRGRVLDDLLVRNPICFSSTMIRRSVLEHVGAFHLALDLAVDYDLWLRLVRQYEIGFVEEELVRYRTGHANLSRRVSDRVNIALSILRRFLNRWGYASAASPAAVTEAWASTYRAAGYRLRRSNVWGSLGWYVKALLTGHRPASTCKSMLGAVIAAARRQLHRSP